MKHRILVSNLGYARDIDGSVLAHMRRMPRHIRTSRATQQRALNDYLAIVRENDPELCCMIEVDTGSFGSSRLDQFHYIAHACADYPVREVCGKYAEGSRRSRGLLTTGKSNGFIARHPYVFERLYFSLGSKRLCYRIELEKGLTLFFTHLSLKHPVRAQQMRELLQLADKEEGDVIIAGDFNILAGLGELNLFLGSGRYELMNDRECGTFTLFGQHYLLDLCIMSPGIARKSSLAIIDQPFSDHDALLITLDR